MQFKDIQQNYPVFIFNKAELKVYQGKVVNKGFPYPDRNNLAQAKSVIDFTIEVDGKTAVYTIPDDLSITYANNLVLSPDKASIINEVEALKGSSEQILSSVDRHKEIVEKTSALLAQLNPAYRDKKETDSRLSTLEASVKDIKGMIEKLVNSLGDNN